MPLLMCPNCNASMSEVKRNDVAFDMCPTCRGVWLDRGELEKLIAGVQQDRSQFYQDPDAYRRTHPQPRAQTPQQGSGERGEYGADDSDRHGRRRRGGFDLFDIFD